MNKNDITDEILVALADDELPETEAAEVHSIVMEHDDLMRRYSSFVETRFLLQEDAKKKIELSVETERFIDEQLGLASEDNVVPLASRKKLQPITRARQFMQMAAALAVGVMVGPLAMMTGVFVTPVAVTQIVEVEDGKSPRIPNNKPGESLRPVFANVAEVGIDFVVLGGAGNTYENGDSFDFSEGMKIKIKSPIAGEVKVIELTGVDSITEWPTLLTGPIRADEIYEIPVGKDNFWYPDAKGLLTLKISINDGVNEPVQKHLIFANSHND